MRRCFYHTDLGQNAAFHNFATQTALIQYSGRSKHADTREKTGKCEALEDKQKLQMKTFSELAECLARIPPKITLYGHLFKYNYVGSLLLFIFLVLICCLQSKGMRISSTKKDYFVGFRSLRSLTNRRWLEKSGKRVGPNSTLKPNTKASSLQFCKAEIKAHIGWQEKEK